MRIRIIVADQSEARFYDTVRPGGRLQPAGRMTDPTAHLHDRDLKSDRPGRTFDRAATAGQRTISGTRIPPSYSEPLPERSGKLFVTGTFWPARRSMPM